ncbi:hypothetical protein M0813_05984 [Anaeramoeba flamelloides]|uniref:Uncharacterized protein n=1 Tax=Anaeramoeba flamelloides TaxID=1746091 RepID=A0ABQ8XG10_9EUKA|nr:hypothetical protein M0813_05984 [Anaeramoeba flamelloides]
MKLYLFFLGLIVIAFVSSKTCEDNNDCKDEDEERICSGDNCVQCTDTELHCNIDEYCSKEGTTANKCIKYSDDEKFGEFCQSDDCSNQDTMKICGVCTDGADTWTGACVDNKCYPCSLDGTGLTTQYSDCTPTGVSGIAGSLSSKQIALNSPAFLLQTSQSIGFMVIGFFFFASLLVQCLIMKRAAE